MNGIAKSIIDKLKLKEIVGITFIASLLITLIPESIALSLKISQFRNEFQIYLTICIVVTASYYLYSAIKSLKRMVYIFIFSNKRKAIKYLREDISPDEMELLIKTFYDGSDHRFKSSGVISIFDGRLAPLETNRIIYRASELGSLYDGFSYNLEPYVLKFLNEKLINGNVVIKGEKFSYRFK